ncbi:type II secretion system F family protein [Falsiroseomonas sp. E2-1-a20]|uniref:type II secretion system F family protein n=1 Tax=Falsiroseomonas sp. E2-1-a20 TaxID=3239300 RepID=UPI003F39A2E6
MPQPLPLATLLMAMGAAGVAIALAVLAATLLAQGAEERDLALRLRAVVRPAERAATGRAARSLAGAFSRPFRRLGEWLRDSAIVSGAEVQEFQRAMAAAGLDPRHSVPVFIGLKAVLMLALPLAALGYAVATEAEAHNAIFLTFGGVVAGVIGPNRVVDRLRRGFQQRLKRGLPDALDLLVVAAEAGLGLETAVDRVAREMAGSNAAIALELNILVQELRMLPDRRLALERMAERTGLEGFKRLSATLSQTLRYGTPLAQAMRVLAADMRQERMLRLEEKAIRLPALLIGPLILFILPALFIALIGPSILEIGKTLGGSP